MGPEYVSDNPQVYHLCPGEGKRRRAYFAQAEQSPITVMLFKNLKSTLDG